jgi:hypothetical protein
MHGKVDSVTDVQHSRRDPARGRRGSLAGGGVLRRRLLSRLRGEGDQYLEPETRIRPEATGVSRVSRNPHVASRFSGAFQA